ncbi:MAG: prepilin peptidase, partial [Acinetobacter sp.]
MYELASFFNQSPTALYLAVGILSLCIGSFLNVVIFRTPKMMEQ